MKTKDTDEFEDSDQLVQLTKSILDCGVPELKDARKAHFEIMFSRKNQRAEGLHKGGICKKTEGSVRHRTKLDFTIVVWLMEFSAMSAEKKVRTLIHELHHIGYDVYDKPKIRPHTEEFCEILNHDSLSKGIFDRIQPRIKVPVFPNSGMQDFAVQEGVRVYKR